MNQDDQKSKAKRDAVATQINHARLTIVETALIAFVESIDNRVPSDGEILAEGLHMQFAWSPLAVFEKDGWKFSQYYLWRRKHLVALGFLVEDNPLALKIVRVPDGEWPGAVRAFVLHYYDPNTGTGLNDPTDDTAGEEWKKG